MYSSPKNPCVSAAPAAIPANRPVLGRYRKCTVISTAGKVHTPFTPRQGFTEMVTLWRPRVLLHGDLEKPCLRVKVIFGENSALTKINVGSRYQRKEIEIWNCELIVIYRLTDRGHTNILAVLCATAPDSQHFTQNKCLRKNSATKTFKSAL